MDFVKLNKFWIAVGSIAAVAVVVLLAVGCPTYARNNAETVKLTTEARKVAESARRADLRNDMWVKQAEQQGNELQAQWQQALQILEQRGRYIEQSFEGVGAEDAGTWKKVYKEKAEELEEKVQDGFLVSGANPIVWQDYGPTWPEPEEMKRETKRYWIQKCAIDSLASLNKEGLKAAVPVFDGFGFLAQPDRLVHPTHQTLFQAVAFEIQLSCEFHNVPVVLASLLEAADVDFYITSLELQRSEPGRAGPRGFGGSRARREQRYAPPEVGVPADVFDPTVLELEMAPAAGRPGQMGMMGPGATGRSRPSGGRRERRVSAFVSGGPAAGVGPQEGEVVLPSTLVAVAIRGYVADYVPEDTEQPQPEAG